MNNSTKPEELRKLSIDELKQKIKDIEFQQIKASSNWGRNTVEKKKLGLIKGVAKHGEKTSIQRDLRRLKARVLTILNEKLI